jgi:transposase InsO family protein
VTARAQGWRVNNKRIQRLWRAEGLKVPYRKRKKPLRGKGVVTGAMCPIRPNVLWALDFQFDQSANGKTLKLLNVIDEFTREFLAIVVADGVASTAPGRSSSIRDHHGRTPGLSRPMAGSVTSSSTDGASTPCSRPRCSSKTGESTTT